MDLLALYQACGVRRLPVDPGLLSRRGAAAGASYTS